MDSNTQTWPSLTFAVGKQIQKEGDLLLFFFNSNECDNGDKALSDFYTALEAPAVWKRAACTPVLSACCCRVFHHQVWRTLPQRANSSPAESLLYFQQLERERNEFQLHSSCFEGSPDKTWQCDQIVPLFSAARVGCLQTSCRLYSVFWRREEQEHLHHCWQRSQSISEVGGLWRTLSVCC